MFPLHSRAVNFRTRLIWGESIWLHLWGNGVVLYNFVEFSLKIYRNSGILSYPLIRGVELKCYV